MYSVVQVCSVSKTADVAQNGTLTLLRGRELSCHLSSLSAAKKDGQPVTKTIHLCCSGVESHSDGTQSGNCETRRLVSSRRGMMGKEQRSFDVVWIRLCETPHMRATRHWRRLGRCQQDRNLTRVQGKLFTKIKHTRSFHLSALPLINTPACREINVRGWQRTGKRKGTPSLVK